MTELDFYLVWSPEGAAPPRSRHGSAALAREEAVRLARKNPGHSFYVVHAIGYARCTDPVAWTPLDDGIPF